MTQDISSSSLKMGRIITELERIYGIRQGSSNPKGTNVRDLDNTSDITQEQIAQQYNISIDKYRNAEKLLNLIPELQDMVQENKVSTTVAGRIIARLSPADQKQLILTYCKRRKCNLCDDVYEILLAEKKLIS